ncbi:MAG: hypothetical protein COW30_00200 [Rhodospirillales bacterium CG15_BIG_FIL_POST_REV_8_21_14_020_66_15]|nr:MAG: hypothetical protein COW30_00200 [Rhodospirillales bacterium CG15_BIG_FIL_POST_REV_8_21_14_020_66_15]
MAGDAADLLKKLRAMGGRKGDVNTLLLVDLSDLRLPADDDHLMDEIAEVHARVARVRGGAAYQLSPSNIAVVANLTEMNRMEVPQELKMHLFKILQDEAPENFAAVDQSKIVRTIDMTTQMAGAIRFLEAFEERAKEQGVIAGADGLRALGPGDGQAVRAAHAKAGDKGFAGTYVQSQSIALIADAVQPSVIAHEYYVRMDLLGSDALKNVDIHESDPLFPQLTLTLDPLMLGMYRHYNPEGGKCALNLTPESVGGAAFQKFVAGCGPARLSNVIVEMRLSDVMRDLRKYEAARSAVRAQGGTVAVDVVDPASLSVVNLTGFNANIAKIVWRESGVETLARNRSVIKQAQDQGCVVVLCRVDSELGLRVGREVGITAFQGLHVEDMLI